LSMSLLPAVFLLFPYTTLFRTAVAGDDWVLAVLEQVVLDAHPVTHAGVDAGVAHLIVVVVVDVRLAEAQQRRARGDVAELVEGEGDAPVCAAGFVIAVAPQRRLVAVAEDVVAQGDVAGVQL